MGFSKVEIGDVAVDGGAGATLTVLGNTDRDSAELTTEEPETQEHYAEESDYPVAVAQRIGKSMFKCAIIDPDAELLHKVFGGTLTGTAPKSWNSPATAPIIEQTVKVTSKQGLTFTYPRARITATISGQLSHSGKLVVNIMAIPQQPTKTGVSAIIATNPA